MAEVDLHKIHDDLLSIALEAGRMITAANPNSIATGTKLNSVDIVTETDQAVERLVSTRLASLYPTYAFVGEETYVAGQTKITDAPTFVVDPIDGTTNFVHGLPNACVSLGFAVAKVPSVGVVYNPFQDVMYTAIKGRGAHVQRNAALVASGILSPGSPGAENTRLPRGAAAAASPPPLGDLSTALVAVEWGSDRAGPNFELKTRVFRRLAGDMVHGLRSMGSAALNLCAVAAGELDAYWEGGCYAWDVCAGWCVLAEAGGVVVGGNPGEWDPALDARVYLAVRGASSGQRELVEAFWGVIGDGGRLEYQH